MAVLMFSEILLLEQTDMGPSSCGIISDLPLSCALNWEPLNTSSCHDKDRLLWDTGICSFLLVIKVSSSILESIILTPSL